MEKPSAANGSFGFHNIWHYYPEYKVEDDSNSYFNS